MIKVLLLVMGLALWPPIFAASTGSVAVMIDRPPVHCALLKAINTCNAVTFQKIIEDLVAKPDGLEWLTGAYKSELEKAIGLACEEMDIAEMLIDRWHECTWRMRKAHEQDNTWPVYSKAELWWHERLESFVQGCRWNCLIKDLKLLQSCAMNSKIFSSYPSEKLSVSEMFKEAGQNVALIRELYFEHVNHVRSMVARDPARRGAGGMLIVSFKFLGPH